MVELGNTEHPEFDQAKRMFAEAKSRLNDADILARSLQDQSDSVALLRILGFEVLLKCTLILCNQRPKNSHSYKKLWRGLPGYVQKEVLIVANELMPDHTNITQLDKLLDCYQFIFEKARYSYELYENFTLKEQQALGEFWVELGAPVEEADIQYYPYELICINEGLSKYIDTKLSNLPIERKASIKSAAI
jgi:hypothetical protein